MLSELSITMPTQSDLQQASVRWYQYAWSICLRYSPVTHWKHPALSISFWLNKLFWHVFYGQNNIFTLWSSLGCGNREEGCPAGTLGQPRLWFAYFIIPSLVPPILHCYLLCRSPWRCLLPPAPSYFFSLIPILICLLPNFRFMTLLSRQFLPYTVLLI